MPMELRSDRLAVFVAVVDAQGFSRGAKRLSLSQSSVSQTISALERDCGSPLLTRRGRGIELTELGALVCETARRVAAELSRGRDRIADAEGLAAGRCLVGCSDTIALYVLPPILRQFRRAYPGVELSLDHRPSPAVAQRVARRELDIGVVSLPLPSDEETQDLLQVTLVEEEVVAIFPRRHPLALNARVSLGEVAAHPLLLLNRSTGLRQCLDNYWHAVGVVPKVAMELGSIEVVKRLVALGFGASLVPRMAVRSADGVVARRLRSPGVSRHIGIVLPKVPSRAATALAEMLRSRFLKAQARRQ